VQEVQGEQVSGGLHPVARTTTGETSLVGVTAAWVGSLKDFESAELLRDDPPMDSA
jgi:hypothetical protein